MEKKDVADTDICLAGVACAATMTAAIEILKERKWYQKVWDWFKNLTKR